MITASFGVDRKAAAGAGEFLVQMTTWPQVGGSLANSLNVKLDVCENLRMPATDPAALAGLFSRGAFRALASAQFDQARGVASLVGDLVPVTRSQSLGEALDSAMRIMVKHYRNAYVFKNSLVDRIVFGRHSPRTAAALLELRSGHSIADVVIMNGTSTAYEIKTELDDFSRLPAQIASYEKCFERVVVVTTPRLAQRVIDQLPPHIGVTALSARGSLTELRAPLSGLGLMSPLGLFSLLHRNEVLNVLRRTLGYEADVPPARLWHRTRDLFATLPIDVTHPEVVNELRSRGMRASTPAGVLPKSLRAMAYEVPLNRSELGRAHERLASPIGALLG